MKVLWLCNIMLPFIAKSLGHKIVVKEGWLSGLAGSIMANKSNNNITLSIAFPESDALSFVKGDDALFYKGTAQGIDYYIFREDTVHPEKYDESIEKSLKEIVNDFEKVIALRVIDVHWMEHINTMSHLREGIHLRGYAQNDPLREYKNEGYELFDELYIFSLAPLIITASKTMLIKFRCMCYLSLR